MIRAGLTTALLVALGCGSPLPPTGPKHTPSGSAETETACPKERSNAQSAREALLGEELAGEKGTKLNSSAAQAVFKHGQCEARAVAASAAPTGHHDEVLAALRSIRLQMQDAINLFEEVGRYDPADLGLRADVAAARLKLSFAKLVSSVKPPADLEDQGRLAFESELAEAAQILRSEASLQLSQALEEARDRSEVSGVKAEICELLLALEWQGPGC